MKCKLMGKKLNRASGTCGEIPKYLTFMLSMSKKENRKNAVQNFIYIYIYRKLLKFGKRNKPTDSRCSEISKMIPLPHNSTFTHTVIKLFMNKYKEKILKASREN